MFESILVGIVWGMMFGAAVQKTNDVKECKIVTEHVIDHAGPKEIKVCSK